MTRWGKHVGSACALAVFCVASIGNADIMITVFPAYAPNGMGSPNWPGYVSNAIAGIDAGGAAMGAGDRSTNPARYEPATGLIHPSEMVYTTYNSWRGLADPNPAFVGNTDIEDEFGNRIHFGAKIVATAGMEFALRDVTWELDSNDVDDYFDQMGNFATGNYSSTRVGINYGGDGAPGGGDDIVYDSDESGSLPVHELTYVGVGDGFAELGGFVSDQDDIDALVSQIIDSLGGETADLIGTYRVGGASGSGMVTIGIPEPSSLGLLLCGIFLGFSRFRRQRV